MWFHYKFILSPFRFLLSSLTTTLSTFFIRPILQKVVGRLTDLKAAKVTLSTPEKSDATCKYPDNITYICISSTVKAPEPLQGQVVYVSKGAMLAWGGTAILERLPSGAVIKTPIPNPYCLAEERDHRRNMRLEAEIYALIGDHPRIPRIINWDDEACCLTMEFLENGNLKDYVRRNSQSIALQHRIRWCLQATEALGVLHGHNVIHCDLSPRNFLLDSDLNLRIADFGGASLSGSDPSATPATRFRHPGYDFDAAPVFQDDIFSLGSLIYFIMTGYYPYEDLPSDKVEKLYEINNFPDVSSITGGNIITQCWLRQAASAQSIYSSLAVIEVDESSKLL